LEGCVTQLHRIVVSVSALDRSLRFYRDLLGLRASVTEQGAARLPVGGGGTELFLHERDSQPSDLAVALSFRVSELDETCARWAAGGGVVVDEPADQPWGERMAVVRDPDGHLVCLTRGHG
jgi:catechol 2,3-dioxygenase-like lactoylglutathione lyase family enzyme